MESYHRRMGSYKGNGDHIKHWCVCMLIALLGNSIVYVYIHHVVKQVKQLSEPQEM